MIQRWTCDHCGHASHEINLSSTWSLRLVIVRRQNTTTVPYDWFTLGAKVLDYLLLIYNKLSLLEMHKFAEKTVLTHLSACSGGHSQALWSLPSKDLALNV